MTSRPDPRPRRRWLRLSLRASMVLVVLVAVPTGRMANTIRTQRQAIAAVRAAGGTIMFDYQGVLNPVGPVSPLQPPPRTEPAAPRWLRRWLGDELFQRVQMVYFNEPVSPSILADVDQFDHLKVFALNQAADDGDGSLHLQQLRRLEDLSLSGPGVTDAILAEIAQLPSLRSLRLRKASATDTGFARLTALRGLVDLTISHCPNVTDLTLAQLVANLPALQTFDLDTWPGAPTATIAALARHHPDLKFLGLARTGTTDADLRPAGLLAQLRGVRLAATAVGDAGVACLSPPEVPGTEWSFDDTPITDASLKVLGAMPNIQGLTLSRTRITDAGLAYLAGLTNLNSLSVGSDHLTDAATPALARLTSLERLNLSENPALTDAGLPPLRALTGLRQLRLEGTGITPAGAAALRAAIPTPSRVGTAPPPRPATSAAPPALK